jgi:aspartokinase/homoserine dehydrogenase 1
MLSVLHSPSPTAAIADVPPVALHCHAHKFGGSSLADASRYRAVAALIDDGADSCIVVVSAMQGVTDALLALIATARRSDDFMPAWSALRERHLATADALDPHREHALHATLDAEFESLRHELAGLPSDHDADRRSRELPGLGEVWSSHLLQAALGGVAAGWQRLDARDVLVVHAGELGMSVDWQASRERLADWRVAHPGTNIVVTGFVARDVDGHATTLGRNGSDYSAAIFANLFDADALTIWTDVDGVLSADPRLVPDAVCLESMSYAEACELAYFGAKVLHPQTMAPAMQRGLPIRIRNTLDPSAPGTLISATSQVATHAFGQSPVKGLSLVEHLAVREDQAEHACDVVAAAFDEAISGGQVEGVRVTPGIAVLAAVGDGMVGTPGVAARLFAGLAQARVNIRAIAQGASERSISVAIAAADATRALRAAHSAFWLSPQTLSIGVIGPGNVGRALLQQLADALPRFAHEGKFDLRLRAIADSKRMRLVDQRLDPADAVAALVDGEALDLDAFAKHACADHLPHALIVDCSGSDAIAAHYPQWLAAGIHVVTPNKHAGSGPMPRYRAIRSALHGGAQFRYEATVGAGLPVIQTLRSLLDTGDELTGIEGVLSGTLAWLFNTFDGSRQFSELVHEARALGYTEPDPRDDLSGMDVARKLVILAREAGRELSLHEVAVESLVPESLRDVSVDEFLARLRELDAPMQARLDAARRDGRSLRYLASLDRDGARIGIVAPEPGHASLHSRLTDNLIQFRTRRYADNPLVVQGPGAGPDVTAAGVFGDILMIAQTLGARA